MHIRCPHCHNPIEMIDDDPASDVSCPSCGSAFNLAGDTETLSQGEAATQSIAHFELVEQLGYGAFGTVWKARDTKLDRTVAIKIPRKDQLSPTEAEQFLREARAAAQLRHAHIVRVHEVGREEGALYIVSDFIEGLSLSDWLSGQQLTAREAAELCVTLAEALHHAHEQGVTHRDLKPSNIMLDGAGHPHIMDFGLAKRDAGEITMTLEGKVLGTPAYMPPEQAKGEGHQADARSDLYSLGVILFELLTGELPFRGNQQMLLHQVIHDEPPSPRRLNQSAPRDLETICLKCLQKEPSRRYQTTAELATDLRHWLDGEPITARPVTWMERSWRWCKRKPAVAGLFTITALLLLTLGVGGLMFAAQQARNAQEQADNASEQRRLRGKADDERKKAVTAGQAEGKQRKLATDKAAEATDNLKTAERNADKTEATLARSNYFLAQARWDNNRAADARELLQRVPQQHRNIEWSLARRQFEGSDVTLYGHTRAVRSVSFSPDGTRIASGSWDRTIRLWDASTGEELHTLKGHTREVYSVSFSPDGTRIASGSRDDTIRLWDASTGEELHTLKGHTGSVESVSFSPDGTRIASGSWDNTIRLWDASTGEELHTLKGHTSDVWSVSFSPDGTRIASGSRDQTIRLWDASTGEELHTLKGHTSDVYTSVSFSPDGKRIASGGYDKIRLWDASTGEELHTLKGHTGSVESVSFSLDGTRIASGSQDKTIRLWDASTGEELHTLKGHTSDVPSVSFSPDGTRIASGSEDQTIRLWDASTGEELHTLKGHTSDVWSVSFSPDGTRLLSRDAKGQKLIWDLKSGEVLPDGNVEEFPAGNNSSKSPDGRWLAISSTDDVLLVDLAYKKTPRELQRRKLLARPKPRWHRRQFLAAQSAKQRYAAVFHAAWSLKLNSSDPSLHDDLHEAYRQLLAAHNGQSPPLPAVVLEMLKQPRGADLPAKAKN